MASIEGIRVVNIHTLSNALKPLIASWQSSSSIKIQRYGKERARAWLLDDGTMVVVNGGGNYIGK